MGHTIRDKQKLLSRIKLIRGQVNTIERALEKDAECIDVLQQITSCRGAMTGLLVVVLEDHIRTHLVDADGVPKGKSSDAREQRIKIGRNYFK